MKLRSVSVLWGLLITILVGAACRSHDAALMDAIRNQEVGTVERLLSGGADAERVPSGDTMFPLEIAASAGDPQIVEMLLDHGASPDSARGGVAPIWLALEHDHQAAAVALVAAGAKFDTPMRKGMTPFYCAVMLDFTDLVTKMVAHDADLYAPGPQGSPLHEAAENGNLPLLALLVANGAEINRINDLGETPIFLAAQRQKWEAVKWIVAHGGNINAANRLGNTILHELALNDEQEGMSIVCELKGNPDLQNMIGETPLHIAAAKGNAIAAVTLIELCAADLNLRDAHGLSPAGAAYREGESDMVDLLTARGGRLR